MVEIVVLVALIDALIILHNQSLPIYKSRYGGRCKKTQLMVVSLISSGS